MLSLLAARLERKITLLGDLQHRWEHLDVPMCLVISTISLVGATPSNSSVSSRQKPETLETRPSLFARTGCCIVLICSTLPNRDVKNKCARSANLPHWAVGSGQWALHQLYQLQLATGDALSHSLPGCHKCVRPSCDDDGFGRVRRNHHLGILT